MMTTKARHTPGPWFVKNGTAAVFIHGGEPREVIDALSGRDLPPEVPALAKLFTVGQLKERVMADACLIAAAPELLEALHVAIEAIEACGPPTSKGGWLAKDRGYKAIHAAIAKAEGK